MGRSFGIRRALLRERGQETSVRSCEEKLGVESHRSQASWTARTDGRTEETNFGQSRFGHPDSYFRDEQVKASDALIDEVGSLLTESGKAQTIDTVALGSFAVRVGDLRLKQGFASDLCENKPYGPHEGECWISTRTTM